jgi:hypothetical protein
VRPFKLEDAQSAQLIAGLFTRSSHEQPSPTSNTRHSEFDRLTIHTQSANPLDACAHSCPPVNQPRMLGRYTQFSSLMGRRPEDTIQFLFHDATTFAPYKAELDVVESVNELLGRSGRRVDGRDGVGFVLRSLPEHARHLFRLLVMEQLALSYVDDAEQAEEEELQATLKSKKGAASAPKPMVSESAQGVEYRVLYHKAVNEFICTSEVAFRSLLKEFHDHQMVESRKDAMGTERLWVPFRQEELEGLAEDLAGDML